MDLTGIATTGMDILIMIIVGLLATVFISGLLFAGMKAKRWSQYRAFILSKDGFGNIRMVQDKAAIYLDKKTNNKRLYLQKAKVGLKADKVPTVPVNGKETVYLYQDGLKQFRFVQIKIEAGQIYFDVGEEDVNWAVNEFDRAKKTYAQTMLMQIMPYIAVAFVAMVILIMVIKSLDSLQVIGPASESLAQTAEALRSIYNITNSTGG